MGLVMVASGSDGIGGMMAVGGSSDGDSVGVLALKAPKRLVINNSNHNHPTFFFSYFSIKIRLLPYL